MKDIVVVTGVAGFIGSHLAEKLLKDNFQVIGIDCFTDYYSKEIKKNNLSGFLNNENFKLIEQNLMDVDFNSIFKKSKFLFHEAAQPGVRASWGNQFQTYAKDNILVTQRILESANQSKTLKKIVMASSSSIYGEQEGIMKEDTTIPKPVSPYGATKLASENLGSIYASNYNLPVISLRYFTVYGPRQRPDMAFSKFILSALKNREISIYGDGEQTRDFTYISDIVRANISCIENDISSGIFNVGGGNIISVNKIMEKLSDIMNKKVRFNHIETQKGDVRHTKAHISKISKLLKFSPNVTIDEGLNFQIEFLKNNQTLYNN